MNEFFKKDEYIKLGQLLKAANFCASGVDAKYDITNGEVTVNGEVELQRGKKIKEGDVVEYKGNRLVVKKKETKE